VRFDVEVTAAGGVLVDGSHRRFRDRIDLRHGRLATLLRGDRAGGQRPLASDDHLAILVFASARFIGCSAP